MHESKEELFAMVWNLGIHTGIGQLFLVSILADIVRYYRVNIVSGVSKSDTILLIYIGIGQYLKHVFYLTNAFLNQVHDLEDLLE